MATPLAVTPKTTLFVALAVVVTHVEAVLLVKYVLKTDATTLDAPL